MDWEAILQRPPVGYGIVTFDYIAANDDEITLRKGERVTIHSKDEVEVEDYGWWLGSIGNRVGVFPMNYIEEEVPCASEADDDDDAALGGGETLFEIPYEKIKRQKVIGSGGFGRVFLGRYGRQVVAVKQLSSSGMDEEELQQKAQELRAEGELIAMCSHINIAKVFGACTTPPNFCLVLEYARGGALSSVLARTTLEPTVIVDFATQIAKGMNYLHHESPVQVVHRDLKSSNILLAWAGPSGEPMLSGNTIKITDFGLARKFTQTTRMTTAGTFAWMAPEVIRTSSFSRGSDVWSYGVLLWELLTSQVPYHGIHMMTVAYSVALKGCTLPIPSECPEPFETLMQDCWNAESRQRPTFTDLLLTLQNAKSEFSKTTNHSFRTLQQNWQAEMASKFKELTKTEQEVQSQQKELERTQQQQHLKERVLDEKEKALQLRELQLQQREMMLLVRGNPHQQPSPIKRNTYRIKSRFVRKKRITKNDIGAPIGFKHVVHVGPDRPDLVPAGPNATRPKKGKGKGKGKDKAAPRPPSQPPPSPPKESPQRPRSIASSSNIDSYASSNGSRTSPPAGAEWACKVCSFKNHPSLPHCEMCESPAPHCTPVPPPRDNPPSRRPSSTASPVGLKKRSESFTHGVSIAHPTLKRAASMADAPSTASGQSSGSSGVSGDLGSPFRPEALRFLESSSRNASPLRPSANTHAETKRSTSDPVSPFAQTMPLRPTADFNFPPISTNFPPPTANGVPPLRPKSPPDLGALSPTNPFSPALSPRPESPNKLTESFPEHADSAFDAAVSSVPVSPESASSAKGARPISPFRFAPSLPRIRAASVDVMGQPRKLLPMLKRRISNPFKKGYTATPESTKGQEVAPSWFQPQLTRAEVLETLRGRSRGSFVIRTSKSQPNNLAISVVLPDQTLWNGLILRCQDPPGWTLGTEGRALFRNLAELVKHFECIPFTFTPAGEPCTLSFSEPATAPPPQAGRPRSRSVSERPELSVYDEPVLTRVWEQRHGKPLLTAGWEQRYLNRSMDSVAYFSASDA